MITKKNIIDLYVKVSSCFQNVFRTRLRTDFYISQTHVVAMTNHEAFAKYKNMYNGQSIAIIATGPSLNKYKLLNNVINIGVNSAIKNENIKLDYLFINDYTGLQKCINEIETHPEVQKFYGRLPEHSFGLLEHNLIPAIIPESIIIKHNARKYYVYSKMPKNPIFFNTDIDKTWLADGGSVVMSALQFALYTNPKRIYLIGCDCSNGYFDTDRPKRIKLNNVYLRSWYDFKNFADVYYPETEIISVNPVGLKGIFKDVYQEKEEQSEN